MASRWKASVPILSHVAGSPQAREPVMTSLRARQEAVRGRAALLPGVTLRQRSGRYWLDCVEGNVVTISAPMTLDDVEWEITRLTAEHVDGCQG